MKIKSDIKKLFHFSKWIARKAKNYILFLAAILIIDIVNSLSGIAIAIVSKNLIDSAVSSSFGMLIRFGMIFCALIFVSQGLGILSSQISVKTLEIFSNSFRQRLFSGITRAEWMSVTKYHSGDILTRLTSDVHTVGSGVVNTLPGIITLGIQLLAAFCTLLYYEPYLAFLAFVLGPITVLLSRVWGGKIKKLQIKVQESESAYRSFIQEALQNILIVKTFGLEEINSNKIETLHNNRLKWVLKRSRAGISASTMLGMGYWAGYLLAFLWGAVRLSSKAITYGTFTAFLQLVNQVQAPFIGLSRTLPQVISTIASAGRLMELEALPSENIGKKLSQPFAAGITCQKVSFSYPGTQPVLDKVSFSIKPGELVAIIGQSGEGKTTLIRMLLALLKPDSGAITLAGRDGAEYLVSAATRSWISFVPQGNTLSSGTIAENIWIGDPEASLEEVINAAQAACAWEFIEQLEDGINTVIGEKGIGLSEGQAQRIAIARAMLRYAPIMIFDEATSALDMETEMKVLSNIQHMQPRRTCIVITHRPSAMKICSRVLKLHEGRITEESIDEGDANCEVGA